MEDSDAGGSILSTGNFWIWSILIVILAGVPIYFLFKRKKLFVKERDRIPASVEELFEEADHLVDHQGAVAFYDLLFSALILILQKLIGVSARAMTREELLDAVHRTGLDADHKLNIQQVLDFCDESRFAGKEADPDTRAQMLQWVKELHQFSLNIPETTD
jgi:hypothetical protein